MIKDITIGQYYKAESVLHKCDPRTKLLLTIAFVVVIFLCKNFYSLALMAALTVIAMLISKVPVKMFLKSMKPILPLILLTAVLNIFYNTGGEILLSFWKITIRDKAVFTAIFIAIRIFCLIIVSSLLTYTTTPTMLTDGIFDRNGAELLRGKELKVERKNAVELKKDNYFIVDIIGMTLFSEDQKVGEITDVTKAKTDIFTVKCVDGKIMRFPFLKDLVKSVDIENKTMVVFSKRLGEVSCYED